MPRGVRAVLICFLTWSACVVDPIGPPDEATPVVQDAPPRDAAEILGTRRTYAFQAIGASNVRTLSEAGSNLPRFIGDACTTGCVPPLQCISTPAGPRCDYPCRPTQPAGGDRDCPFPWRCEASGVCRLQACGSGLPPCP